MVQTDRQTDQRLQHNKMHAFCLLVNYGYKQTPRIRNTYYFSKATMVSRTCLDFTL